MAQTCGGGQFSRRILRANALFEACSGAGVEIYLVFAGSVPVGQIVQWLTRDVPTNPLDGRIVSCCHPGVRTGVVVPWR